MDAKEYIRRQFANVRIVSDAATADLTDEVLNWTPAGTANPISSILIHMIAAEDAFVQTFAQGKPQIWKTEAWGEKIGIKSPPGRGGSWTEFNEKQLSVAPMLDYQKALRTATDAYLASLTPEELDRKVEFMGRQAPVADVLALLVVHTMSHAGEIAALKGVQGCKGLPF